MNKLDRFRFGNLHKRRIFGVITIFVLIAFTSAALLAMLGFFGSRSELPRINLSANSTNGNVLGVGFNILDIPDCNIIEDPFFDSKDECIFATVTQADGNYIFLDPSEGASFVDIEANSELNILSIDAEGDMGLRFSSLVTGVDVARFGVPVSIQDYEGVWNSNPVVKAVESNGTVYALTSNGVLVQDVINEPEVVADTNDFIDICSSGNFVYALSMQGDVYLASEGGDFTYICSVELEKNENPLFISAIDGCVSVFFDDGHVRTLNGDSSFITANINSAFVATNSDYVIVVDNENQIYVSNNGLFYSLIEELSSCIQDYDSIIDAKIYDSYAFILTNYGSLISYDLDNNSIVVSDISSIEPIGICAVNDQYVIAIASDYQAFVIDVSDGSADSLGTGNTVVENVFRFGDNQFLLVSSNNLYETSLMSALEVANPIGSSIIESGDICMVKTSSVNTESWDIQGETRLVGRDNGVYLSGSNSGLHVMSRLLSSKTAELFEDGVFYRIDVAMSSNVDDMNAYIWLEGETFGQEGMQVTVTNNTTDVYSFVFAVTENMIADEYLRFNIAFEGLGVLNIDYVYVGPSSSDVNTIPSDFYNCIVHNQPTALRFSSMIIGGTDFCGESFYGIHPDSAESALIMSRDAGANPWFLMGSQITQSDVDNFLGYMCGSVSSEYGKRRIDNGTALPWCRQFNYIMVEICDSEDAFLSDVQRGAYVDYVKGLFERSSFYIDIKDRILFIDGMNYDGGVVLSSADRHASSMSINTPISVDGSFIECVSSSIDGARFNAPRSTGGEYISSISFDRFEGSYTAADLVSTVIQAETSFADIILFDSDTEVFDSINEMRFLFGREQMYYEVLDPVDTTSDLTSESLSESCDIMLIDGETSVYLVVANHSDSAQQFLTQSTVFDIRTGSYSRYSPEGELLLNREINRFGLRQNLQAGEYLIITIPKV